MGLTAIAHRLTGTGNAIREVLVSVAGESKATRTVDGRLFLSTVPAEAGQRRLALAVVAVSAVIFLVIAPFARVKLTQVWAFIPIYESALVINDLITALLLFGQYGFVRSRSLLILASGYLFTALMTVMHALSFPGLFSPTGLLGAGVQSTAWLYMFWHGGFPLVVIAYTLLKDEAPAIQTSPQTRSLMPVVVSVAVVVAAVAGFTALATSGQELLPPIMGENHQMATKAIGASVWTFSLVALVILWRRKPHTVLDLWLMVVMCVWMFDIALAAVLNAGRFDLGFYAGRIYGLAAASFVLGVLLMENSALYARVIAAHESERLVNERLRMQTTELVALNKELETFSYSVSHDLRAPLRAIDGYALMLEEDYVERLDDEGKRLLAVIRGNSRKMGVLIDDLLALSRLGRQEMSRTRVDMERLVRDVCKEAVAADGDTRARIDVAKLPSIMGDQRLLRQVWINLDSNAIKYSRRVAEPRVDIDAHRDGAETVYRIRDNGAGFDMQYSHKLFGVFQRLHRSEDFAGTGVGLAIVARIVARHGGRVWAEGKVDEGATFYVSLPAEDAG